MPTSEDSPLKRLTLFRAAAYLLALSACSAASTPDPGATADAGPADSRANADETAPDSPSGSSHDASADAGTLDAADAHAPDAAPPTPGATVTGTLGGKPVVAADTYAVGELVPQHGIAQVDYMLDILITDYASACTLEQASIQKANSNELQILFDLSNVNHPATPPTVTPRAYPYDVNDVNNPTPDANGDVIGLSVFYDALDATCHLPDGNNFASKGTITIASATSQAVTGSFDLTFTNGDHLTGTFDSPMCPVGAADAGITCQ